MGNVDLFYRFNADVLSVKREGNRIVLDVRDHRPIGFTVAVASHGDAIEALSGDGATLSSLDGMAAAAGDPAAASRAIRHYLERFAFGRLLAWQLADGEGPLGTVAALAARYQPRWGEPPAGDQQLCRFAYVRRADGEAVLESGNVRSRVHLNGRGLSMLAALLAAPAPAPPASFAAGLWQLGFLETCAAVEPEARRCWEFQDLLMHEASRNNRDAAVVGGTYRFDSVFASPPAVKPAMPGSRIGLDEVDPGRIRQASSSVDEVQARRRSVRRYAAEPVSRASIGEFLWRVCRTTGYIESSRQDIISRPYPAGGSINELEFYLAVRRCSGLDPAVYHYDSHGHALVRLAGSERIAGKIVERSGTAMGLAEADQKPDVTVVIASRLPRLAWKYEGMAYRASLMNAGVVFHLMYMVATDMGLAPCANGTGDSRLLQEVAGLDRFEETVIAEFALGMPGAG